MENGFGGANGDYQAQSSTEKKKIVTFDVTWSWCPGYCRCFQRLDPEPMATTHRWSQLWENLDWELWWIGGSLLGGNLPIRWDPLLVRFVCKTRTGRESDRKSRREEKAMKAEGRQAYREKRRWKETISWTRQGLLWRGCCILHGDHLPHFLRSCVSLVIPDLQCNLSLPLILTTWMTPTSKMQLPWFYS